MDYKTILIERSEPVLNITLNRPKKLNAMNIELISEMLNLFGELRIDQEIRYVTFTGADRAFSSGADVAGKEERRRRTGSNPTRTPGWLSSRDMISCALSRI